ncbi:Hypothetical predicted protein, partial [Olea europaea subsp. europaea]
NKDYKDKDSSVIYIQYRMLFYDTFDSKKYVVTPMKLCRIGFDLFKDSDLEYLRNLIPLDNESSSSNDEVLDDKDKSSMDILGPCSGDKHKFASRKQKRKEKIKPRIVLLC